MTEPVITKRLHIAGLTPALTATDISQRLSSFGHVKAVDGFGLLDGVGRPRKFGYVTLETTQSKFTRCCNALSGSTWKGAKLRIGEAKADFRERIVAENEAKAGDGSDHDKRERKRRKIQKYGSVHAKDMSLVTKESAKNRPGWVVTPLGRTLHPMRMRPVRPLTDTSGKGKGKGKGKMRSKTKEGRVVVRARRRKIDMLQHGSVYLSGVFVDVALPKPMSGPIDGRDAEPPLLNEQNDTSDDEDVEMTESAVESEGESEKSKDDVDDDEREAMDDSRSKQPEANTSQQPDKPSSTTTTNKLKDLFAPQEENGFSLLGHLDLDLELDEDIPFSTVTEEPRLEIPTAETVSVPVGQSRSTRTPIQLNPKHPFFFPLPSSSTLGPANKGRQRDQFHVAKEQGWNWRDPSVAFYRTETEDEIRKRWEESKLELTREWKRRSREAGKMSRRKYGGVRGDGE